jgi:outer membrane protein assembly factor BamE (lipoprotein component of BamABCDE complex)
VKKLVCALALCLALGCSALSGGDKPPRIPAARIEKGMSAERVKAVLGEPAQIEQGGPEEKTWYYENGVIVMLRQGKVFFVGQADKPQE